jgi:hypothetical protein
VLYSDPTKHCGDGKELVTADYNTPIQYWASEYIPDFPGLSYRYFVIANKGFWFEHWSTEDWRSNCGEGDFGPLTDRLGEIYNLNQIESSCRRIQNPVYAIDFVAQRSGSGIYLLAIDWNPAPRLAGTPVEKCFQKFFGGNKGIAQAISNRVLLHPSWEYFDNNLSHLH